MQAEFKLGDFVEVPMMPFGSTAQGIYITYDPTNSKPHLVHLVGRKYGRARFAECRIAKTSEQ